MTGTILIPWSDTYQGLGTQWTTNASVTTVDVTYQVQFDQLDWRGGAAVPPAILRRAERLLLGRVSARQRATWERFRYIIVPSRRTPGVVYRIPASGMIRMYERGRPVHDLCIHGHEALPDADRVLAMKLLAEAEEDELLRIAVRHTVRPLALVTA